MVKITDMKGCKKCKALTEEIRCPKCGGKTTNEWTGFLVIIDYSRSQIADNMGIKYNGEFALKVS